MRATDGTDVTTVTTTVTDVTTVTVFTGVTVVVIADLDPLVAAVDEGTVTAAGVDIPIGLAAREPRRCDREARRLLGPRRSSVFPAPVHGVLDAPSYAEACAISRRMSGKAISTQLYNIVPKIREVDAALSARPGLQEHVFEMCPELSFAVLAGAPMTHPKRTAAGRSERLDALRSAFGDALDGLSASPPPGAAPDDVLDALAGLSDHATPRRRHLVARSAAARPTRPGCVWKSSPEF